MRNIYFIQPNFDFGPNDFAEFYLPYSVGILWSYAIQFEEIKNNFTLADIIFKREDINVVLDKLINPAVAAFSCYAWNWEYNKELAKLIRNKYPDCIIVFGGPSVTDKPYQKLFFQNHRYVNAIINGEGEYSFKDLLQDITNGSAIKKIYASSRVEDLSTLPSPYLTGVFDPIIKNHPDVVWQMVLETNRGCPFQCTFCDWGSLTYSKIKKFDFDRVIDEIRWAAKNKIEYIYLADANFGIFVERDTQIAMEIEKIRSETGYPKFIAITWNKNAKVDVINIAKIIKSRGLTISLQSFNEETLEEIKRKNMDVSNMTAFLPACEEAQVPVYTELILGLPHETKKTWRTGHYKLLDLDQHGMLDVYLAMVLENSELNSIEQIEKHDIKIIDVENYLGGDSNFEENGIVEKSSIINSTKYLSFEDMIDSFMFSWVILMCHYMGYTQIYSRYLNSSEKVAYREFYESLYDYIITSDKNINQEYNVIKNIITIYLSTGKLESAAKFSAGHNIMWNSISVFSKQNDSIVKELQNFVKLKFNMPDQVIDFQKHFTIDINQDYPYNYQIQKEIYNAVFVKNKIDSVNSTLKLKLDSKIKTKNIDIFCRRMYTERRASSSKVIIEVDK